MNVPASAEDAGPERDIPTLLARNRELIDQTKAQLKDVLEPKHDDIFILRYCLSYKNLDSVVKHIVAGLEYRKKNPYLELEKEHKLHPQALRIRKYTCASYHGTKKDGGPIQIIRAGCTNVSGLFAACDVKDIIEEMTLSKEEAYNICDRVTRETGKLTKQIVIFDMANVGWVYPSQSLISSQNEASEIAKNLFPQLLEKVVIINAPWFMAQLWKLALMVLSESLTSKVGMCGGTIVPGGLTQCPYASVHIASPDVLPTFVGGTCNKCVPGCVGDVPNDFNTIKAADEAPAPKEEPPAPEGGEPKPAQQGGGGGWLSGWW